MAKAKDVKEILDGRREFTLEMPEETVLTYYIANPSGEDIRKADWQYSKIYNQAIVDNFLTQTQMLDYLKDKGILDDEYTEELERVRTSLAAELFRLENILNEAPPEERESCALAVASLRDELFQLNQKINGPMGNTCENLAEDARTEFLTGRIIQKKDGDRLWEDFQAYRAEENTPLTVKSRFEVMLWMQGLGSDFLENTPEQTVLREVAQARMDEVLKEEEEKAAKSAEETEAVKEETSEPAVEEISLDAVVEEAPKANKRRGRPKGSTTKKKTTKKQPKKKKSDD